MNSEVRFVPFSEVHHPEQYVDDILPWLHEAGNPFYDWLYGGPEATREILTKMLTRRSSEMWIGRVSLLFDGSKPIGGFIGTSGELLTRCVSADMLALLRRAPAEQRVSFATRTKAALGVFPPVDADQYYLSVIGICADYRGRGLGRRLVEEFLTQGNNAGFQRFRLNVMADNQPAVSLYRSFGFEPVGQCMAAEGQQKYYIMVAVSSMKSARSPDASPMEIS